MGYIQQSLRAQPKTMKKLSKHQINQSEQNFQKKKCVFNLKVKRSIKRVWGLPGKICKFNPYS
jgi:hypothetical protein